MVITVGGTGGVVCIRYAPRGGERRERKKEGEEGTYCFRWPGPPAAAAAAAALAAAAP
jgi:hypothetical protein